MGVISSNKTIDTNSISCEGSLRVTLALTAAPDISENPTDIVLVLDRSGSMTGTPLSDMKLGANTFIDIIDESTDGSQDGQIGGGSHIGIVSFATTAVANTQLITSVADLKSAVDSLNANGQTNHVDAFTQAINLFDPSSQNAKVIVMFTDGNTTVGAPPAPVAEQAKNQGIVIYCIGLIGADGIDVSALNDWASDPDSTHVAVTPTSADLEQLFEDLAANISKPGATDISIDEVLNSDFTITNLETPNFGTANIVNPTTIHWEIDQLGVTTTESAVLQFDIQHTAQTSGTKQVNGSITYDDAEGNVVTFPNPEVDVNCCNTDFSEECPTPVDFSTSTCEATLDYDLGENSLEAVGRIVTLSTTIRNVCPNKRVALAVQLSELDDEGLEYERGLKTFTIPAHTCSGCQDVNVSNIKFILPEDISVSSCSSMCCERNLRARVISHYIDAGTICDEVQNN